MITESDQKIAPRNEAVLPSLPKYTLAFADSLPKFDRSVSWLCWAYNEGELIEGYLLRANELLKKTVEDYEIVVVDDCSTDRTFEIVTELKKKIPQIKLMRNPQNLNVGLSSQKAILSASKEYLFWQPVDWCYDLSFLRIFLELLKTYDIVVGVRRSPVKVVDSLWRPLIGIIKLFGIKHLTKRSDSIPKAIVSVLNYVLIRVLFRVPLSDYQNVVFYPTSLIQSMTFESKSSFSNPEGLLKAYWKGASIAEVPISFLSRQSGEAKGTRFKAILSSVVDITRLWFKWVVLRKEDPTPRGAIRRLQPAEWEVARA